MTRSFLKWIAIFLCVLVLGFISFPVFSQNQPARDACLEKVFLGFDSRLNAEIIGRLHIDGRQVMGFEIVGAKQVVAFEHEIVGLEKNDAVAIPITEQVKGIATTKQGDLFVQTATGVNRISGSGLTAEPGLSNSVHGRLFNSGNSVFLEARGQKGLIQFIARARNGNPFLISTVQGQFHSASWNDIGLAAVVGNSLLTWEAGTKSVSRILADEGLRQAQDVCLVGPHRAVVALGSSVILVTSETMDVIVGMPGIHCRFQNGVLYLFNGQTGLIWALKGLDNLGTKNGDNAYARKLIREIPKNGGENSAQFLEAARIIGCEEAHKLLAASGSPAKPPSDEKSSKINP